MLMVRIWKSHFQSTF